MLYQHMQDIFNLWNVYKATVDVASLIDAAGATVTVSCPGVILGKDAVIAVVHSLALQGITYSATVESNDNVAIRYQNESGGTVDLASQQVAIVVGRVARI